jgi:putative peptide maturation dehydrogenase
MTRHFKRSPFVSFWIEDTPLFDVASFLRGDVEFADRRQTQLFAASCLTEEKFPVTLADLRLLAELPADSWSSVAASDVARLEMLARQGLVVSDSEDPELALLRQRFELLASQEWHPYSAQYYFLSRERESVARLLPVEKPQTEELAASATEEAARYVERFGLPPSAFHSPRRGSETIDLPLVERSAGLYDVLLRRRTTRAFNTEVPLQLEDLSTLLYYVFGCQGRAQLAPGVVALHKTSPSGGSLHPIEAYPLVLHVDSLDSGFYHYEVETHSLQPIRQLGRAEARDLAFQIGGQQTHARSAHVLIAITARFRRSFWKYRRRSLAFGAVLLDAGHLSQTFYLVATDLGLGVFFSAVIDGPKIEEVLGLQAPQEGALAFLGCGIKAETGPDLGLDFEAYLPQKPAN